MNLIVPHSLTNGDFFMKARDLKITQGAPTVSHHVKLFNQTYFYWYGGGVWVFLTLFLNIYPLSKLIVSMDTKIVLVL